MDNRLFRDAMGKFATGVTVVTTAYQGEPYGMTANAFMSVSLDPKLVVVSIGEKAKFLDKIMATQKFGVSILAEKQEGYSRIFSGQSQGTAEFNWLADLPVLDGSLAQIACEVVSTHVEGDHTLFIGKVLDIHLEDHDPLLFFEGKYQKLMKSEEVIN